MLKIKPALHLFNFPQFENLLFSFCLAWHKSLRGILGTPYGANFINKLAPLLKHKLFSATWRFIFLIAVFTFYSKDLLFLSSFIFKF